MKLTKKEKEKYEKEIGELRDNRIEIFNFEWFTENGDSKFRLNGGLLIIEGDYNIDKMVSCDSIHVSEKACLKVENLVKINDDLTIGGTIISPNLKVIGGCLTVATTVSHDFPELRTIGKSLVVGQKTKKLELNRVTSIGHVLELWSENVKLNYLQHLGGNLNVFDKINIKLPQLRSIDGEIHIYDNSHVILPEISYLRFGDNDIGKNSSLKMERLRFIDYGHFSILTGATFDAPTLKSAFHFIIAGELIAPKLSMLEGISVDNGNVDAPNLLIINRYCQIMNATINFPLLSIIKEELDLEDGVLIAPKLLEVTNCIKFLNNSKLHGAKTLLDKYFEIMEEK